MSTKKDGSKSSTKAAPKSTHPPWIEMIKECISAHKEDARMGVSRPQIKKFVEETYQLEIGAAQTSQLSKALSTGNEKGIFVLPKGPSGRVKLAPKNKQVDSSDSDENKPVAKVSKPTAKPSTKSKPKTSAASSTTKKSAPKPRTTATSKAASKPSGTARTNTAAKKAPALKPTPKPAPKKTLAGKAKASSVKKTSTSSKRASAKQAVIGTTAPEKAKAAAKKAPARKISSKTAAKASTKGSAGKKSTQKS